MVALYCLVTIITFAFASTSDAFAITGLQGGVNAATGERPIRQEISTFQQAGAAFDLYILSLRQFMQRDQSDPLSYYQIAGIHGYPHISWDGAIGQYNNGYCTHGSILFPPWHRAYMALFEQILSDNAQQIASTYPASSKAQYQSAAATLRMPYWDWATNSTLPDVATQPLINVNTPNGSQIIDNPLYNYTFHPLPSAPDFPAGPVVTKFSSTVRYPDSQGRSQASLANQALNKYAGSIRTATYNLLSVEQDYGPFSNTGNTGGYNNLEGLHNALHTLVGGVGGHMTFVPFSAFDPIFWLHHTNVDRLWAIWQAVHPETYVTSQIDHAGTYTYAPNSTEDVTSALTPFHADDSNGFHTSNTTRSTRAFGYTYPELLDWNMNTSVLTFDVKGHVNTLYGPIPTTLRHKQRRSESRLTVDEMSHDYSINVVVNGSDVTSGMYVHFFLGAIPIEEALWPIASSLVGSHIVNGPSRGLVFGQIPLTPTLTKLDLPNLESDAVVSLIRQQLNYRVQSFDGRSVEASVFPSLKFAVLGRNVTHMGGNEFPDYGPLITFTEATSLLAPHGLQEGESMPA